MPIHTVRQRKNIPDVTAPEYVHWFFRFVHRNYLKFALKVMGIAPPDHVAGGWNEGQHSYTEWADAAAHMRQKGRGWFIETTPLNEEDTLPDESVTFGSPVFPIGEVLVNNSTNALPIALPPAVRAVEARLQSMIDQADRRLAKNRNQLARSA